MKHLPVNRGPFVTHYSSKTAQLVKEVLLVSRSYDQAALGVCLVCGCFLFVEDFGVSLGGGEAGQGKWKGLFWSLFGLFLLGVFFFGLFYETTSIDSLKAHLLYGKEKTIYVKRFSNTEFQHASLLCILR